MYNSRTSQGHTCMISEKLFAAENDSREAWRNCYAEQQEHTNAVLYDLEQRFGEHIRKLSPVELKRLYKEMTDG